MATSSSSSQVPVQVGSGKTLVFKPKTMSVPKDNLKVLLELICDLKVQKQIDHADDVLTHL
jgi:hypothetical protein